MTLSLDEIMRCTEIVFSFIRRNDINSVSDDQCDFYWTVLSEEWLDFQREPKLAVGSLSDDIEQLKKLLKDESAVSSLDIERLASVLKLLAEKS